MRYKAASVNLLRPMTPWPLTLTPDPHPLPLFPARVRLRQTFTSTLFPLLQHEHKESVCSAVLQCVWGSPLNEVDKSSLRWLKWEITTWWFQCLFMCCGLVFTLTLCSEFLFQFWSHWLLLIYIKLRTAWLCCISVTIK